MRLLVVDVVVWCSFSFFKFPMCSLHFMAMIQFHHEFTILRAKKVSESWWRRIWNVANGNYIRNEIRNLVVSHYSFIHSSFFSFFGSQIFVFLLLPITKKTKQEQQLRVVEKIRREQRPSWRKPIRVIITSVFRNLPLRRRRRLRELIFILQHQAIILPFVASPDQPDPYWHRQQLQEGLPPPVLLATAITATNPAASGTWKNGTKSAKETEKRGSTTRNGSASNRGSTNTPTFASTIFLGSWHSIIIIFFFFFVSSYLFFRVD